MLGGEIRQLLPDAIYPFSSEFDVANLAQMAAYLSERDIKLLINAAAFTSPPKCETDPIKALDVNIVGTANVVKLCCQRNIKLVYISTDYVFAGDRGNYQEDDPVLPGNKYAWSKLGGECAVKLYDNSLIIRTSFGPNVFPYPAAFVDQWTSRQSASEIASKIVSLIDKPITGVIHVGGQRRTVYEYAKSLDPGLEIGKISIGDMKFKVPRDTSLNCERLKKLF